MNRDLHCARVHVTPSLVFGRSSNGSPLREGHAEAAASKRCAGTVLATQQRQLTLIIPLNSSA